MTAITPDTTALAPDTCLIERSRVREIILAMRGPASLVAGRLLTEVDALPIAYAVRASTPAALWRQKGEPDPHADRYDCERTRLAGGNLTDDEVANAVFLNPSIGNLTAAKDRIRWLSRALVALREAQGMDQPTLTAWPAEALALIEEQRCEIERVQSALRKIANRYPCSTAADIARVAKEALPSVTSGDPKGGQA